MSGAIHNINSKVDNALDASATPAEGSQDQAIIASLWDRTFVSYPPEMVVKMPYYFSANYTVTVATGITTSNQFKVNSLFDPDLTGGGHQPLGRDTWCGIYDYYKVLETRIHVTQSSNLYQTESPVGGGDAAASAIFAPTYVGGLLDITANPPASFTVWQEAAMVTANSQERFGPIQRLFHVASRGPAMIHYDMTWTPGMFDTGVLNVATENTWTPVGSDPTNLNYFTDIVFPSNVTRTIGYQLEVKLEYLVAFKNVNRTLMHTTN